MQLPVILPPMDAQRYDCQGCTHCCRDLLVQLTSLDRRRIDQQNWSDKLGVAPYIRHGQNHVLSHTPDGACVFLTDDGKCRIHAEHGLTAKPLACQLYPFTLEADADGLRIAMRFDCPTVARNTGSPLAKHRRDLGRLAAELAAALPSEMDASRARWELVRGHPLAVKTVDAFVEQLHRWVRDQGRPLDQRLLGLHELIQTLVGARLDRFDDDRLCELIALLTSDLGTMASQAADAPIAPPTVRQSRLFRQTVFAHCERVSPREARASLPKSLARRWDQLRRARRLAAGCGPIPRLGPMRVDADFDRLEGVRAAPGLSASRCDDLLTRYLQARIACRTAFGRAYYGWPILDGLHDLLLAVAVIGWLVRCVAVADDRDVYGFEDLVKAVGIVDAAAGRAPGLGSRSARLRLHYLARDRGLVRLLMAYPIIRQAV